MSPRLKPYPAYKESGVEWLGRIPEQWRALKVKRLTLVKRGASPRPIDDPVFFSEDGDYAWVRISDVTSSARYLLQTEEKLSELGRSKSVSLEPGELFLSIAATVGKPIITKIKCCIHDGFVYFVGLKENREYLYWLFSSGGLYQGLGKLGTQLNLNTDTIGDIRIPVPQSEEQSAIAAFLDRETAKIDALVKKKERLIELLQEKRTALISHAVTQGLNPNVPKKDSGIPWLGMIPSHWHLKKLGQIAVTVRGGSPRPAGDPRFFDGDACPWITVAEVTKDNGMFLNETETYLTQEGRRHSRFLEAGTLVMTNSGATLGVPKILNISGCINDGSVAFLGLKATVVRNYLYYYLSSLTANLRERIKQGSGQPNLNTSIFRSLWFPVGSVEEQEQIVGFVDTETAKLDALTAKVRTAIERLQEYRTALISAAVTGQIDVRNNKLRTDP